MPNYQITYVDGDAVYPAHKQIVTVECDVADVWSRATEFGVVQKIIDMESVLTLYSVHWSSNSIGVTQAQINENLSF